MCTLTVLSSNLDAIVIDYMYIDELMGLGIGLSLNRVKRRLDHTCEELWFRSLSEPLAHHDYDMLLADYLVNECPYYVNPADLIKYPFICLVIPFMTTSDAYSVIEKLPAGSTQPARLLIEQLGCRVNHAYLVDQSIKHQVDDLIESLMDAPSYIPTASNLEYFIKDMPKMTELLTRFGQDLLVDDIITIGHRVAAYPDLFKLVLTNPRVFECGSNGGLLGHILSNKGSLCRFLNHPGFNPHAFHKQFRQLVNYDRYLDYDLHSNNLLWDKSISRIGCCYMITRSADLAASIFVKWGWKPSKNSDKFI